nr:probable WRKY transcription factor 69 [Ipomoea batatas]
MDGEKNDWDLSAVVRGCKNLNGNSSSQDVHEHFNGGFASQTYVSVPLLPQPSHYYSSVSPSIGTERRYFGLEEVIDRFTNGKARELALDPQATINPPTSLDKVDGSGGMGKDTPALQSPDPYFGLEEVIDRFTGGKMREPILDLKATITRPTSLDKAGGSGLGGIGKDTRAPQSPNPSPTLETQQPLPSSQTSSPEKDGGLEDENLPHQVEEVAEVEMSVVKVKVPVEKVQVPAEKVDEWDGWEWRKYGTKMMNGSPHSKGYYRCNHEEKKCPAKKHVQLSYMDESTYIITYKGNHNHPPPVQTTTSKRKKRSWARARPPAPPASKGEGSFSTPSTNTAT